MSAELHLLLVAVVIGLVYVSFQALLLKAQVGNAATVGARDDMAKAVGIAARADRALRNFIETFPLFVALVTVTELAGAHDVFTFWGALTYVVFRALYLPLYLMGVPWLRTISWNIATAALAFMLVGAWWNPSPSAPL